MQNGGPALCHSDASVGVAFSHSFPKCTARKNVLTSLRLPRDGLHCAQEVHFVRMKNARHGGDIMRAETTANVKTWIACPTFGFDHIHHLAVHTNRHAEGISLHLHRFNTHLEASLYECMMPPWRRSQPPSSAPGFLATEDTSDGFHTYSEMPYPPSEASHEYTTSVRASTPVTHSQRRPLRGQASPILLELCPQDVRNCGCTTTMTRYTG